MSNTAVNITAGVGDDSVGNNKLAEMAANSVKANATTGTANPTDVAISPDRLVGRAAAVNAGNLTGLSATETKALLAIAYSDLPAIADKTVLGNASGSSTTPTAQDANALMGILNTATTTLLSGTKITADTITASQIAPNAIGSSELADGAVDTAAIADANVTKAKLEAEVREARQNYATTAGTASALTISLTPAITAYTAGMEFVAKAHATANAGATLNANAVGAKAIQKMTSSGLVAIGATDVLINGIYEFRYDGTVLQVLNPAPSGAPGLRVESLTGSGNWTVPAGVTQCVAEGEGGGGGGAAGFNGTGSGGGGGSGAWGRSQESGLTPGGTVAYVVGPGGAGSTSNTVNGTSGTATTFGSSLNLGGGQGGRSQNTTALGGTGGTLTTALFGLAGRAGGNGSQASPGSGGNGADAPVLGLGGVGGLQSGVGTAQAATGFGSGGGGGGSGTTTNQNATAGRNGYLNIYY